MKAKNKIARSKLIVSMALLVPLLFAQSVLAQERPAPPPPPDRAASNQPNETRATILEERPVSEEAESNNSARQTTTVEQTQQAEVSLSPERRAAIAKKCKPTQAKLTKYAKRVNGVKTGQKQALDGLLARLHDLSGKLASAGVEAAELNSQISMLEGDVNTLREKLESFETAVNNAAGLDCAADPAGYMTSLKTARMLRAEVVESAAAVKARLSDNLKPALKDVRKTVAARTSEENS